MKISSYLCYVIGESSKNASRYHSSTIRRMKAFAIAIHIPVVMWALTSYVIATQIFHLEMGISVAVAIFCAGLIYFVERLVLITPKGWLVTLGRLMLGVVIALLGASTVDLVVFDREISQQLNDAAKARIETGYSTRIASQQQALDKRKAEWLQAKADATCEANGTCGSKVRSVGPIYRELSRHAEALRTEYVTAQEKLDQITTERSKELEAWSPDKAVEEAGLLNRLQALHNYTTSNPWAMVAWGLFFGLVLIFELMVVLSKVVFKDTVDDELERVREEITRHKANAYKEAITSPVASAKLLLEAVHN